MNRCSVRERHWIFTFLSFCFDFFLWFSELQTLIWRVPQGCCMIPSVARESIDWQDCSEAGGNQLLIDPRRVVSLGAPRGCGASVTITSNVAVTGIGRLVKTILLIRQSLVVSFDRGLLRRPSLCHNLSCSPLVRLGGLVRETTYRCSQQ